MNDTLTILQNLGRRVFRLTLNFSFGDFTRKDSPSEERVAAQFSAFENKDLSLCVHCSRRNCFASTDGCRRPITSPYWSRQSGVEMMEIVKVPGWVESAIMSTLAPSSGYSQMPSMGERSPESHHSRISVSEGKKAYVGADIRNISADSMVVLSECILIS